MGKRQLSLRAVGAASAGIADMSADEGEVVERPAGEGGDEHDDRRGAGGGDVEAAVRAGLRRIRKVA